MAETARQQRWKGRERKIAKILGAERIPVSGRGDGPDVVSDWLAVECKAWATLPVRVVRALEQAERGAKRDQLPIAVLCENSKRTDKGLVVMRLSDFRDHFGEVPE